MTVYFARRVSDGMIKIGTSYNAPYRVKLLAEKHGDMVPLATARGDHRMEGRFHALLDEAHVGHEWFLPLDCVSAVIAAINAGVFDFDQMPDVPSPARTLAAKRGWLKRRAQAA